MQTYYLNTLLLFFKSQAKINYDGIETIISILEADDFTNEEKRDAIFFLLHRHGLNETTRKDGRFEPQIERYKLPPEEMKVPLEPSTYHEVFMTQMISVEMLNGPFFCEIALN